MLKKLFPFVLIIFVIFLVFRNFFLKGLVPIPGDLLIGAYYPWLDYNWGFITGVPVKNPLPSDVISIIYPSRILGMEIIKKGFLPLWDPTILLGTPLLANFQAAILNPLNVLFLILSSPLAWTIEVVSQPFLVALATFLYLRNLGLKKLSSVFGGLAFAFSGFSIVWMEYNTIGFTLACFPFMLFLVDKIFSQKRIIHVFLLGVILALQLFSGYPQISIYTLMFLTVYALYRCWQKQRFDLLALSLIFLGVVSGVLFAAIQLLPSYELLQLSIRSIDETAANAGIQFLPFTHLVTLLAQDFFGNPVTKNYWFTGSYDNFAFYLAPIIVFLIILSILKRSIFKRENLIFIFLALLSLILATDNYLARWFVQSNIPGLSSAVAVRALFVFDFALVVLSSKMFEDLISDIKLKGRTVLSAAFIYTSIILLALAVVKSITEGGFSIALRNSTIPLMTVVIGALSICFVRHKKYLPLIVLGLLIFNIVVSTDKYFSFISPSLLYPDTEVTKALKNVIGSHRFDREEKEIFPSNTWTPLGLKAVSGQDALYSREVSKYLSLVNGYYPHLIFRFVDVTGIESPLYDTLDIQYLTVLKRGEKYEPNLLGKPNPKFVNSKFQEFQSIKTVKILRNTQNLGFAWFSKNTICASSESETVKILQDVNFNTREKTVIKCSLDISQKDREPGLAELLEERPNYQKIKVTTPEENYLTVSEALYPGWEAFVDGQQTQIFPANLALMSVLIPKGDHVLELKYTPQSFNNGMRISLFSLLGWFLFLLGSKAWRRYNKIGG